MNEIFALKGPDGLLRYVGHTTTGAESRVYRYKSTVVNSKATPVLDWIREIGFENLSYDVLEQVADKSELRARAQYWVAKLESEGADLLNISKEEFGDRVRKALDNPVTKAKQSSIQSGRTRSPETRAKMSAKMKGRIISPEHRKAIGDRHRGKVVSEETRHKISEKAMGHKRNAGRVQSAETRLKMSHTKHVNAHNYKGVTKEDCRWCAGDNFETVLKSIR